MVFLPEKSKIYIQHKIIQPRYTKAIEIMRANKIYRDIRIPDIICIDGIKYGLHIRYPTYERQKYTEEMDLNLELYTIQNTNSSHPEQSFKSIGLYNRYYKDPFTDKQFIQIIKKIDSVINELPTLLNQYYPDIDDQKTIDELSELLIE